LRRRGRCAAAAWQRRKYTPVEVVPRVDDELGRDVLGSVCHLGRNSLDVVHVELACGRGEEKVS
jgi:hypothetical protein